MINQSKIQSLKYEIKIKIEECRAAVEEKNQITQKYAVAEVEIETLKARLHEISDKLYSADADAIRKNLHSTIKRIYVEIFEYFAVLIKINSRIANNTSCVLWKKRRWARKKRGTKTPLASRLEL